MAKWLKINKKANIKEMASALKISETMARVLVNRDINNKKAFNKFINPALSKLGDFLMAKDVVKAMKIVKRAIEVNKKIMIYGDYDVDGVTSTVILLKGLRGLGADVDYYIPERVTEGYGLNSEAVKSMGDMGIDLLITCDNGISAIDEIDEANELGIKTIIIDHHEPGFILEEGVKSDILPDALAIIDPKQRNCMYPFKFMCAAGLCYRFITVFYTFMGAELKIHDELLILASLATFCDVVELIDENRIIAKNGLEMINRMGPLNVGLEALIKEKAYTGKEINEFAAGFIIGPCINASGRLKSAGWAVELFLCQNPERAAEYAEELSRLNEERKEMTQKAVEAVVEEMEAEDLNSIKVCVIFNEEIHESVAGIVAGRIKEKYHRPVIIFTGDGDVIKGSGRSIEGYNIYESLYKYKDLFIKFGGHPMAAGLSMEFDYLEELYLGLNRDCQLSPEDFVEIIRIDKELTLDEVTYKLYRELEYLSPFGRLNKEPLFGTKAARVEGIRVIPDKDTIILNFEGNGGRSVKGLLFGKTEKFRNMVYSRYDDYNSEKILGGVLRGADLFLDIVYYISLNEYNNSVSVQMNIKDFRLSN